MSSPKDLIVKVHDTLPIIKIGAHEFTPGSYSKVRFGRSLVFYVVFCRSLFVLLSSIFWHLRCIPFYFENSFVAVGCHWVLRHDITEILLRMAFDN